MLEKLRFEGSRPLNARLFIAMMHMQPLEGLGGLDSGLRNEI